MTEEPGGREAREAAAATRGRQQAILAGAADRDEAADARDVVADKRDEAVSRDAFLADREDYAPALEARRSAAVDRLMSKSDRTSSALDREKLTGGEPPQ